MAHFLLTPARFGLLLVSYRPLAHALSRRTAINAPGNVNWFLCDPQDLIFLQTSVAVTSESSENCSNARLQGCTLKLHSVQHPRAKPLHPSGRKSVHHSMPSPLHLTFQALFSTIGAYLALLFRATARVLFEREPVESEGEPEALDLGILRLDQAIHQADFELARARAEAEAEATR